MTTEYAALEARIQRLEDIESIRTLKSRYHTLVNDTDFDQIGGLFAADASVNLGYLMPDSQAVVGRERIQAAFSGMTTSAGQSQLKQFLHSHMVELTGPHAASGTGMLYACYGVDVDAYVVAGKYSEDYVRVDGAWLFSTMNLTLYFSVPLALGWAGPKRHYLVNSGPAIPDYAPLLPNPAV
uniref:SnoaL-like domain-containing protein n=1 Tax=Caulobacter sp. (strain K31) TaxID=366602 RepID=B0T6Q3_CAUSK